MHDHFVLATLKSAPTVDNLCVSLLFGSCYCQLVT